jgi:hypothetical protein
MVAPTRVFSRSPVISHRIEIFIVPPAVFPDRLAQVAFAAHAQLFHHARRGEIPGEASILDPVQKEFGEAKID